MYYGYYYRGSISTFPFTSYHMPSAYLAITTVCITYQLIMLASRSGGVGCVLGDADGKVGRCCQPVVSFVFSVSGG